MGFKDMTVFRQRGRDIQVLGPGKGEPDAAGTEGAT
jgi:hypothetical protein